MDDELEEFELAGAPDACAPRPAKLLRLRKRQEHTLPRPLAPSPAPCEVNSHAQGESATKSVGSCEASSAVHKQSKLALKPGYEPADQASLPERSHSPEQSPEAGTPPISQRCSSPKDATSKGRGDDRTYWDEDDELEDDVKQALQLAQEKQPESDSGKHPPGLETVQ